MAPLGSADAPGPGKPALTLYRVVRTWGPYALVALYPKTGRTHQLRVHLSGLGCPIVGDPIYGRPDPLLPGATLMLHARRLRIRLPDGSEGDFRAPVPQRFRKVGRFLEGRGMGREG